MLIQPLTPAAKHAPPLLLLPWLKHETSLTNKLRQMAGEAHLVVLKEGVRHVDWWATHVLGLEPQTVFQREIMMFSGQIACWYARTIIPHHTWCAHETMFKRLERETLGDIIFSEPAIKRYSLVNYAIDSQSIEYYWFKHANFDSQWLRLSVFTIDNNAPFFLVEIFLPGLSEIIEINNEHHD